MRFSDPDEAILECHRTREASASPSRSIAAHGRHYDFLCPKCRRHAMEEAWSSDHKSRIMRCAHCMTPRPWSDAYVLSAHVASGKGGSPPGSLLRAGDFALVGGIVDRMARTPDLPPGAADIYQGWLMSGLSQAVIAMKASEKQVAQRAWTESDVKRVVRHCRRWLQAELEAAGLFGRAYRHGRRVE